jgi:hypothetical protein
MCICTGKDRLSNKLYQKQLEFHMHKSKPGPGDVAQCKKMDGNGDHHIKEIKPDSRT